MKTRLTFLAALAVVLLSVDARAASLIGWWKLDESSGMVAEDSSVSENDGTVYGDAEWEDGVIGGGLNFDGNGDCVDISNPSEYSTEDDFTWSAWVRCLDGQVYTDGGVIIAKCPDTGDYGNGSKCLYVAADGKLEFNINGSATLSTDTKVNDGLWHHVALTVEFETSGSNDTAKLYIDGADDATKNDWNVNQYSESDALKFGFANNNFPQSPDQTYFYGRMDDVRIYDYVLDLEYVENLFVVSGYWRFVATGDSRDNSGNPGVNDSILGEIVDAIIAEKAEVVVFPGDEIWGHDGAKTAKEQLEHWRNDADLMKKVYDAGIIVMPIRGNHEANYDLSDADWEDVLGDDIPDNGPDEATYENDEVNFTYYRINRNALFIGMDVYKDDRDHNVNQAWLDDVLADNTMRHVFVFTHEPAFNARHSDGLETKATDRDTFWGSLEDELGCHFYFCGHDHFYDRAWIDDSDTQTEDVHQIIVGTAGAPNADWYNSLWDEEDPYKQHSGYDHGVWTPKRKGYESEYGYVVVEIWGGSNVTAHWKHRVDNPVAYTPGGDVWSYSYDCFPSDDPYYGVWVAVGKPYCWCYPRQCRGDADDLLAFGRPVTLDHLAILNLAFGKDDEDLALVENGICADFDHEPVFGRRVGLSDLDILKIYFGLLEAQVPECFEP